MGKSFWVLCRIFQSFQSNQPCCYIDPKGDTYRTLLAFLSSTRDGRQAWERYKHRIRFLNPVSASGLILGFNALESLPHFAGAQPDRIALLANSITSHLRRQSGFDVGEAVRMQNIMAGAIGLLTHDHRCTMAEIPLLFVQSFKDGKVEIPNPFVKELLRQVNHLGTLSFWRDQYSHWTNDARRQWVQSTLGRVFQFLFDERMLFTSCTTSGRLNFRQVVDEGLWLFVNLPYPFLSETVTTILGNFLVSKIFLSCMQRPHGGAPYRLILDEARLFNTGPLDQILETSLAYNLSLTLVVQSLSQMARSRDGAMDWHLMETALTNARYVAAFQDFTDRKVLAELMFPVTGLKVAGLRQSGDNEYLPVAAEENANQRRFAELGPRQMIFWDKSTGQPIYGKTPDVVMSPVDPDRLEMFEAEHLQLTGVLAREIREEVMDRQERIRKLFDQPRTVPPAEFGRWA